MQIFDIIARPLGFILSLIYSLVNSYGLAIIIFTIIIKVVLLPLSVKQMKSQQEISRLQPKLREIEKKYKGDKTKIQEETMKLYKQEGVSMTGGCLPLLIQLPIIFGLYQVIYRPLALLIGLPDATITKLRELYGLASSATEIELASLMQANPGLAQGVAENIKIIDFNFLGINLALIPKVDFTSIASFFGSIDVIWLIPLFSVLTAVISSWVSKKYMPTAPAADNAAAAQTKRMTDSMLFIMPLMSLYFSFILPAGVGLYWGISNILAAIQQYALFKYIKPLPPIALDNNIVEKRSVKKEQLDSYVPRQKDQKQKPRPQNSTAQKPHTQKPEMQRTQGQQSSIQRPQGQRPPGQRPPNTSAKKNFDQTKKGENADD
jgi:YidC/Oxa1 family membrane protein insertase